MTALARKPHRRPVSDVGSPRIFRRSLRVSVPRTPTTPTPGCTTNGSARFNTLPSPKASWSRNLRGRSPSSTRILAFLGECAREYNVVVSTGSMPTVVHGESRNVSFLVSRNGNSDPQEKLRITPHEHEVWGVRPGKSMRAFETRFGRVAIQVCYDIDSPRSPDFWLLASSWFSCLSRPTNSMPTTEFDTPLRREPLRTASTWCRRGVPATFLFENNAPTTLGAPSSPL